MLIRKVYRPGGKSIVRLVEAVWMVFIEAPDVYNGAVRRWQSTMLEVLVDSEDDLVSVFEECRDKSFAYARGGSGYQDMGQGGPVKAGNSSQSSQATEASQTMLPTSSTGEVFRLGEAHAIMTCLRKCSMKRSVEALIEREIDKRIYQIR